MMCITIPTKGIHATQEVMIPKMLPVVTPPSFFVKIKVTMCNANITPNGIHNRPRIIVAPRIGTPKIASRPPLTHFNILDVEITLHQPSLHLGIKYF